MSNTHIALIPAYQPTDMMIELLRDIKSRGFFIVVVNDGSSKEYDEIFTKAKQYAVVLNHNVNRGKGRALKTGLEYINNKFKSDYIVVTMDADGQHKTFDALRLCKAAEQTPNALILGSRGLKNKAPLRSRAGNAITRTVYRLSTGHSIYDTQTGLRAFSSCLVSELISIPGERFEYEMNVLLNLSQKDIPIREIEIETVYYNNNSASHFNAVKDSYRIYKEILKFSASSFIGFLVDYFLFSLLSFVTAGLSQAISVVISNVGARVVSAAVNYTVNRKFVFKSSNSVIKSAIQYFMLAAAVLAGNTLVLSLFTNILGVNQYLAKLCTEIMFFILNWLVQRYIIFRRKEKT